MRGRRSFHRCTRWRFPPVRRDLADDVVVNAPTDVIGARVAALAPPGVLLGVGVDEAEGVAEFAGEQIGQPRALLREEAAVFQVALPVFQVFFGVGDVDVAAEDEALARRCPRVQPRRQFRHKGFFLACAPRRWCRCAYKG